MICVPYRSLLLIDSRSKISFGIGMKSQTQRSKSTWRSTSHLSERLTARARSSLCWRHERAQLSPAVRASITAEARERGGGAVKVYSQVGRVFSRSREGKISEHLETFERRAILTMEWSLRGFKHKKWQDQLRSDCFLPYCSHGASVRRRKRKVGVLWNGLLYKVKP